MSEDLDQGLTRTYRAATTSVLLAVCVVFGAWVAVAVRGNTAVDFYVYYLAGALARKGHSFYLVTGSAWTQTARDLGVTHFTSPYRYPPVTAALAGLLMPLGRFRAMLAWEIGSAAAVIAGAVFLGAALGGRWRITLALGGLAVFGPAYHTLVDGQVNGLVFLSLAVALWGFARGRDGVTGAGVACAAALKLTPVALLAYLAWRRRWRALVVAVVALAALAAASLPLTGAASYGQYADSAYALTDPQHVNPSGANQTATGVLGRLLLPSSGKADSGSAVRTVRVAALCFALALAAATAAVTWPRRRPGRRPESPRARRHGVPASADELLGFGAVIAATLVVGPFTYYHQFVWLLIPLVIVATRLIVARRWRLLAVLGLLVVGLDANEIVWVWLRHPAIDSGLYRTLSLPFCTALVVWGSAAVMILRQRADHGGSVPQGPPVSRPPVF